jgi:group I intron endonuclease
MALPKVSAIYEIVNTITGHRYVGSAVNLRLRWARHRHDLPKGVHRNRYLQNAWNKYGRDAFEFRIIELCAPQDLISREQHYLDAGCDYNIAKVAGSPLGTRRSAETRALLSAMQIGKKCSPEAIARSAAGHRGLKRPPDAVERTAAANRGIKRTPEGRAKTSAAMIARMNDELRAKMSASSRAAWARRKVAKV